MFYKSYSNFVRASSLKQEQCSYKNPRNPVTSGDEARRIYLEEVKDAGERLSAVSTIKKSHTKLNTSKKVNKEEEVLLSDKDFFIAVQNNDVDKVMHVLDKYPDKINIVDEYGWSLLMIACQANSIDCAQELLKRGINISVRDKAGNSARSLVIKNKNYAMAGILLNYRETESKQCVNEDIPKQKIMGDYICDICNNTFPDRDKHLSSTLHNISASKSIKIPANYAIPVSNRGYQLMLKGGWDRDSGLGKDGTGKKYPIKTIQKKDRKGLGHLKIKNQMNLTEDYIKNKGKIKFADHYNKNRRFEINFRREFY